MLNASAVDMNPHLSVEKDSAKRLVELSVVNTSKAKKRFRLREVGDSIVKMGRLMALGLVTTSIFAGLTGGVVFLLQAVAQALQ